MWTLVKKFTFEAAHQLTKHQGKCSRLHGHSWVGYVYVSGDNLKQSGSEAGMVMDYGEIKKVIIQPGLSFLNKKQNSTV